MVELTRSSTSADDFFYNEITFEGPFNDYYSGAPSYVIIKSLEIRQLGQYVQFIWEGEGTLRNDEEQYFFLVFDTDLNADTGQNWGGSGGELKIIVYKTATLHYFDASGNLINEIYNHPVHFEGNRFYLTVDRFLIPSQKFNLYFESSGQTRYYCRGRLNTVELEASTNSIKLIVSSDSEVLEEHPHLMNIEVKDKPVKLHTFIEINGVLTELLPIDLEYRVTHDAWKITDPTQIISVDSMGYAHYMSEGYVYVTVFDKKTKLVSEQTVIATGKVYGDPDKDDVIAIFPEDYPESTEYSFGSMMRDYPNYIEFLDTAYRATSQMYGGYKPFNGDKQILALLVLPGYAGGGNLNPLETSPEGYLNYYNGQPQYIVVIHEMGHNFAYTIGMSTLLHANNHTINQAGFGEGVASLPVIYLAKDMYDTPEKYNFTRSSFEWSYWNSFVKIDNPDSQNHMNDFENLIKTGQIKGIFDNGGKFDGVSVFCSLFQQYVYDFTEDSNPYRQEVIPRFLSLFPDDPPTDFQADKVQTYFAASFSAAIGHDIKDKLSFWGFTIDDTYYNHLYPILQARVRTNPTNRLMISNPSGSGTTDPAPGNYTYYQNATVSVKVTPQPGWLLDSWVLDGLNSGTANPYQLKMNEDHTLKATFKQATYSLLIDEPEGSGITTPKTGAYVYNQSSIIQIQATPSNEWKLDHWVIDGINAGSINPLAITMNSQHTIQAVFTKVTTYALTIKAPEGSGITDPAPGKYDYNQSITIQIQATPSSGWVLKGWVLDGANVGTTNPYTINMNSNHELEAVFAADSGGITSYPLESVITGFIVSMSLIFFTNKYPRRRC